MELGLKGKTAIVLAASKGIGKAIAERFAEEGSNVVIASRNESNLKATATEIMKKTNPTVKFKTCDLSDPQSIRSLVSFVADQFGSIDVLVNNSGGPPKGYFKDFDDTDWQSAFELTLLSYIRAIREVLPYMTQNKKW